MFYFVSLLIGCTGRSILHCEFSIFFHRLPYIPSSVHTQHGWRDICHLYGATTPNKQKKAAPCTACPCVQHLLQGRQVERSAVPWGTERFPSPLGFLIPGTAMSICCAPHTCSGRAGVLGNDAQPSVGVASKHVEEPVRMGPTVQAAVW